MIKKDRLLRAQERIPQDGINASLILMHDGHINLIPEDHFQSQAVIPAGWSPIIIDFPPKASQSVCAQMWCSRSVFLLNPFQKANPMVKVVDIAFMMDEPRMGKDKGGVALIGDAGEVPGIGRVRLEDDFHTTGEGPPRDLVFHHPDDAQKCYQLTRD